jgi:hypothetical protein
LTDKVLEQREDIVELGPHRRSRRPGKLGAIPQEPLSKSVDPELLDVGMGDRLDTILTQKRKPGQKEGWKNPAVIRHLLVEQKDLIGETTHFFARVPGQRFQTAQNDLTDPKIGPSKRCPQALHRLKGIVGAGKKRRRTNVIDLGQNGVANRAGSHRHGGRVLALLPPGNENLHRNRPQGQVPTFLAGAKGD